ncbi:MAG: acetolactate synthase small subunit [Alphaproteobacteria bacterium]|nr:acetolactate synthase small subunit [Alphaproteobacteria bacterium]
MSAQENTKSVYGASPEQETIESHTLSVIVDNEPGVLARVIGLFSGRGYNIESLTVAEIDHEQNLSRITVVSSGTPQVIDQIKNQLERLVPVHRVIDLTVSGPHVSCEVALVKIVRPQSEHAEVIEKAKAFDARSVDTTEESIIFEVTGDTQTIDNFINVMKKMGLTNMTRTGIVALMRGPKTI